jgi:RNA polymerase sigma factor (TIGR02999 family)
VDGAVEQKKVDPQTAVEVSRILGEENLTAEDVTENLMPLVYEELRHLAAYRLAREQPGQTLEATALVHEVFLRLVKDSHAHWENKRHFFVAAAEAMRRILIENARRKNCRKRGGDWQRSAMDVANVSISDPSDEVLDVHEVLDQFNEVDPESAELVKLRFFAGLTQQQCADILGISKRTADNRWAFARAWLFRAIRDEH